LKHDRATEELREVAALYALGSLTQYEARGFEIHLNEGCSVCAAEFRKFAQAVSGIGLAADEAAVPEYLRDLLSARIDREPKTASSAMQPSLAQRQEKVDRPIRPVVPAPVLSLSAQTKKNGTNVFAWILVAVLAIVAVLAFFSAKTAREMNIMLQAEVSAAKSDREDLRGRLDDNKRSVADLENIIRIAGKPTTRLARLAVQASPAASSAAVIWDTEQEECRLLGYFPLAPEGKKYQLWFFTPAAKVPAGSFKSSENGETLATIAVPKEAANATTAVVTLEPDNGSQIPTTPYYAIGRIE
jgi:anti-sigma-K factor RskA